MQAPPSDSSNLKTLWMADVEPNWDDASLALLFSGAGLSFARVMRDRGQPYGILEFISNAAATAALNHYNGQPIAGSEKRFRLAWYGGSAAGAEHAIFVGDLGPEVTDYQLLAVFQVRYPSVRSARVVTDPQTGNPKGYGFVRFGDESEASRALYEMQGMLCGNRAMRIASATPKAQSGGMAAPAPQSMAMDPREAENDPTNTTLFIGGIGIDVDEDTVRKTFGPYGNIVYLKMLPEKSCCFVQYMFRHEAESAMEGMHGMPVGGRRVRMSWGRSPLGRRTVDPSQGAVAAAAAAAAQQQSSYGSAFYGWDQQQMLMQQQQQAMAAAAAAAAAAAQQAMQLAQAEADGFGYQTNVMADNEDFVARHLVMFEQPWLAFPRLQ